MGRVPLGPSVNPAAPHIIFVRRPTRRATVLAPCTGAALPARFRARCHAGNQSTFFLGARAPRRAGPAPLAVFVRDCHGDLLRLGLVAPRGFLAPPAGGEAAAIVAVIRARSHIAPGCGPAFR